jgi:hypothetical protein
MLQRLWSGYPGRAGNQQACPAVAIDCMVLKILPVYYLKDMVIDCMVLIIH